jgi:prepilin-type N-terminal cleavage/methylation domain-containing protein
MNKNRGFTMVEVIVVGVIVAILAAVAIPTYTNYLNSTKQNAVDNLAQTAAAAANSFYRRTGSNPAVSDLNLFYDQNKYSVIVTVANSSVTVSEQNTSFTKTVTYH